MAFFFAMLFDRFPHHKKMLDRPPVVVVVNVDLYSASTQTPLTRSDMYHTVLPANNTISAFTRKHSPGPQVAPPCIYTQRMPEFNLLLIYRPQEDEWLSWPCWLIYSGQFTQRRSTINCMSWLRPCKFASHRPMF